MLIILVLNGEMETKNLGLVQCLSASGCSIGCSYVEIKHFCMKPGGFPVREKQAGDLSESFHSLLFLLCIYNNRFYFVFLLWWSLANFITCSQFACSLLFRHTHHSILHSQVIFSSQLLWGIFLNYWTKSKQCVRNFPQVLINT